MNILIFGDLHISQSSLIECKLILNELLELCNKYSVTKVISLGDNFDSLKPSSRELDLFASFLSDLNKPIIILAANSHESTTESDSILNHYGILSDKVTVVKEYKAGNHLFCGHFVLTDSTQNYGAELSKEDLKDYLYVFLGHQHSYELIKPNIVHLGSSRFVNFDESKDKHKIIALITDYSGEKEQVHFISLKTPIPMVQIELKVNNCNKLRENNPPEALGDTILVQNEGKGKDTQESKSSISQAQTCANLNRFEDICQLSTFLANLSPKTKVKVKILDFEGFKQFLPLIAKYSYKFEVFKYQTKFDIVSSDTQKGVDKEIISFKESFTNWLKLQKIDSKITEILLENFNE